jgi:hypothetical protein
MDTNLTEQDTHAVITGRKILSKDKTVSLFVASKTGSNARGDGTHRSVILIGSKQKGWKQWHKVWGANDEIRAREIIRRIYAI